MSGRFRAGVRTRKSRRSTGPNANVKPSEGNSGGKSSTRVPGSPTIPSTKQYLPSPGSPSRYDDPPKPRFPPQERTLPFQQATPRTLRESINRHLGSKQKIPEATIDRLSTYARVLNQFQDAGDKVVSSAELARSCGLNPAQIRKDLAYFGEFGVRGKGYYVGELRENLKKILGVTQTWKVALVGAGNLGAALLAYKGFLAHGFIIEAVFDKFPEKVEPLKPGSPPVMPMTQLAKTIRESDIRIGIVAVPSESTQGVVDRLVEAGVTGILNFAPTQITAPPHVKVNNVDLGKELESLSYHLSKKKEVAE